MITLQEVSKAYRASPALGPISLHVGKGESVAILGPSGCGKSTLLRLIVGLVWPDSGRVAVADLNVDARTVARVRQRVGFVLQEGGLFPHLTVRDNVALAARAQGWSAARIDARAGELLGLVRLPAAVLARYPQELSGGQRQRVALMRALMLDPDVLLLDEPLGALDPIVRAELGDELRRIIRAAGGQKTMILVTHDLPEAAHLAERLVLLREGHVVQQGGIDDFAERPADPFVTTFLRAWRPLPAALAQALAARPPSTSTTVTAS